MKMEASFLETKKPQTKQNYKPSLPSCWNGSYLGKKISEDHWVRERKNKQMSVTFQAKEVISVIVTIVMCN